MSYTPIELNYFASSASPDDEGTENTSSLKTIVPPADMQEGDLVIVVFTSNYYGEASVSTTGGQTWTRLSGGWYLTAFWCRFNGTWAANPSFTCASSTNVNIATMHVFRPTTSDCSFSSSGASPHSITSFSAPSSPFDVTVPGLYSRKEKALFFAAWTTADLNTWELQTAGWSNAGKAQYRYDPANSATNRCISCAYKKQDDIGFSGDVVNRQTANGGDSGYYFIGCFIAYQGTLEESLVFHLDPENGDDANSGMDWDHPIKTLYYGANRWRVKGGDEIRFCKSPEPVSLGINGTWFSLDSRNTYSSVSIGSYTADTPVVVSKTGHGFVDGDAIVITGSSTHALNGVWTITKINDNSYSLDGSVGTSSGTSGSTIKVNQFVVKLASAPNLKTITRCETAWTAANGATVSRYTTDYFFEGNACLSVSKGSPSSSNTLYAYLDLGSEIDFSEFQGITFFARSGSSNLHLSTNWKICLCSDAAGATVVDTFIIPDNYISNGNMSPITAMKVGGGNLGSSIRSIAIYMGDVPVTSTLYLDNILACKENDISLQSLIGKESSYINCQQSFNTIKSISEDCRILWLNSSTDKATDTPSSFWRSYVGNSETTTVYRLETLKWVGTGTASDTSSGRVDFYVGLSAQAFITISGGWNKTTNIRDGLTLLDGVKNYNICGIYFTTSSGQYSVFKNLSFCRYSSALYLGSSGEYSTFQDIEFIVSCGYAIRIYDAGDYSVFKNINWIVDCVYAAYTDAYQLTYYTYNLTFENIKYIYGVTRAFWLETVRNILIKDIEDISHCKYDGIFTQNITFLFIKNIGIVRNIGSSSGAFTLYGYSELSNVGLIKNATTGLGLRGDLPKKVQNIALIDAVDHHFEAGGKVDIKNIGFGTFNQESYFNHLSTWCELTVSHIDGDVSKYYYQNLAGKIASQSDVRHTESGVALKFNPTVAIDITNQISLKGSIAKILCAANKQVTVKAWMRRSNTGLTMNLVCPGGQVAGIDDDVVSSMTAEADTWEEVTISFTPTATGVVEIMAQAYGGTTYSGYVDDLTITHEA